MHILPKIERATPQESAKFMRAALRRAFPGVAFRARMSRGTGWGTYYVSWTGGPSKADVEVVTRHFEGKDFDGMTDSTLYRHVALPDGRECGIGYIFLSRHEEEAS